MDDRDRIPLAACAEEILRKLAAATGSVALEALDGATLLCERAMLAGMSIPGRTSAGGGCRLLDAIGDTIALNLSRAADRELLPALLETDNLNVDDGDAIGAQIAQRDAAALLARGRSMGMATASEHEDLHSPVSNTAFAHDYPMGSACVELVTRQCTIFRACAS
jgi:hypothetical protein